MDEAKVKHVAEVAIGLMAQAPSEIQRDVFNAVFGALIGNYSLSSLTPRAVDADDSAYRMERFMSTVNGVGGYRELKATDSEFLDEIKRAFDVRIDSDHP